MISGEELKRGLALALRLIESEKEYINAINVYPVADGDTGTNILLTIKGAMQKVNGFTEAHVVAREIAEGMLESAKGNSGVILSQFFWGFMEAVSGKEVLSPQDFARALVNGAKMAYLAVDTPVEGTMLTVMRAVAEEAVSAADLPKQEFLNRIYERAVEELNKTPEMLAKLGKPKVIDSGAYGFVLLLEGLLRAAGRDVEGKRVRSDKNYKEECESGLYCSNFLVELNRELEKDVLKEKLRGLGNSLVLVANDSIFKVHIHTREPEKVKDILESYGRVKDVRIEEI